MIFEIPIFQLNFKNLIFFGIVLIPLWLSNNLLLLLTLISRNKFFVIPNNGIYGINSCNINRALVGAQHTWFYDWLICLLCAIYLSCSPTCMLLFLNCALTSLLIAHGGSLPRYVPIFPLIVVYACLDSYVCMIIQDIHWLTHQLSCQLHFISRDPTLGT